MARKWRHLWQRQNLVALGILALSLLVYLWASYQTEANLLTPEGLQQVISRSGGWGILVYIAIIALAVVISPIPGAPLTVAAGAIWGAIPAAIYSVIGGLSGVFVILLVLLPWGIRRHNWFGLRDIIRIVD